MSGKSSSARNINKSLKKPLEGNFWKASIDEITYLSAIAVHIEALQLMLSESDQYWPEKLLVHNLMVIPVVTLQSNQ